jgi:putative heme-binding domain-containing protein
VSYVVATKEGRVLAGTVRAEGADAIRVIDADAKATVIPRVAVDQLRASGTSIMPVGLAGALGEQRVRDLVAFLTTPPKP